MRFLLNNICIAGLVHLKPFARASEWKVPEMVWHPKSISLVGPNLSPTLLQLATHSKPWHWGWQWDTFCWPPTQGFAPKKVGGDFSSKKVLLQSGTWPLTRHQVAEYFHSWKSHYATFGWPKKGSKKLGWKKEEKKYWGCWREYVGHGGKFYNFQVLALVCVPLILRWGAFFPLYCVIKPFAVLRARWKTGDKSLVEIWWSLNMPPVGWIFTLIIWA